MDFCSYSRIPEDEEDIESDHDYDLLVKPSASASASSKSLCKKKKRCAKRCVKNCCKIVLKLLFILFMILFGIVLFVGIRTRNWIAREVQQWTVSEPINNLPVVNVPVSELETFKVQVKNFINQPSYNNGNGDGYDSDSDSLDLEVPARTVNGLVSASDYLRGNAYVTMKRDYVKSFLSLPMDYFPGGKDRFLVGVATLDWFADTSSLRFRMDPYYASDGDGDARNDAGEEEEEGTSPFFDLQFSLTKMSDDKTLSLKLISGQVLGRWIPQDIIDEHINLLEDMYHCNNCHDRECKRIRNILLHLRDVSGRQPNHLTFDFEQYDD